MTIPATAPVGFSRTATAAGWNVLIFLAALAVFEGVMDRVSSPFQGADKVERKFAYFAAHKDEYDVVFVGSSRVMNQLSPKVFDARMAAAGRPCRSFNLGVSGMFLPECSFVIDQVRALHPARLRTMVIELSSPAPRHDAEDAIPERAVYWHRPWATALACAAIWTDLDSRATAPQRAAQVGLQTMLCARCMVRLGDGARLLGQLRKRVRRHDGADTEVRKIVGSARDGFIPMRYTLGQGTTGVARTGGSTPDLLAFEEAVGKLRAGNAATDAPAAMASPGVRGATAVEGGILARKVDSLRAAGIEPVFLIAPGTASELIFRRLHAEGALPTLLAFNDPAVYPDLYAPEVRADRNHLNATGAERFSRRVAEAMVAAGWPVASRPGRR